MEELRDERVVGEDRAGEVEGWVEGVGEVEAEGVEGGGVGGLDARAVGGVLEELLGRAVSERGRGEGGGKRGRTLSERGVMEGTGFVLAQYWSMLKLMRRSMVMFQLMCHRERIPFVHGVSCGPVLIVSV